MGPMTEEKKKTIPIETADGSSFEGDVVDIPLTLNSLRVAAGNDGKVWCFLDAGNNTWHGLGVPVEVAVPFAEALLSCVASMLVPGLKEFAEGEAPGLPVKEPDKKDMN